ncbi:MAG: hypothetical protein WCX32_00265 [Clostridia bacterium]|nr:hypothetical protein [Clostridia bacterium]
MINLLQNFYKIANTGNFIITYNPIKQVYEMMLNYLNKNGEIKKQYFFDNSLEAIFLSINEFCYKNLFGVLGFRHEVRNAFKFLTCKLKELNKKEYSVYNKDCVYIICVPAQKIAKLISPFGDLSYSTSDDMEQVFIDFENNFNNDLENIIKKYIKNKREIEEEKV